MEFFNSAVDVLKTLVVAEKDVVQLVLFNLFFQPRGIFGKVFAFQAYFYVDLVPVFFS